MKILLKDINDTHTDAGADFSVFLCDGADIVNVEELKEKIRFISFAPDLLRTRQESEKLSLLKNVFDLCKTGAFIELSLPADPQDIRDPAAFKELLAYAENQLQVVERNIVLPPDLSEKIRTGQLPAGSDALKQELCKRAEELTLNFILIKTASAEHHYGYVSFLKLPKFVMRLYPLNSDQWVSRSITQVHYIEPFESAAFLGALRSIVKHKGKAKLANIGANLGWYTVIAAVSDSNVTADAFEPTPQTLEYLRENRTLSGAADRIRVFPIALSDKKESCELFIDTNNAGSNSLMRAEGDNHHIGEVISIETDTLDNIYKDSAERPDVIVMDVEGHEQKVLDGAAGLLGDGWRPVIFAEFTPSLMKLRGGCTYFRDLFNNYSYRLFLIDNQQALHFTEISPKQLQEGYDSLAATAKNDEHYDIMMLPPDFAVQDFSDFVSYLNSK